MKGIVVSVADHAAHPDIGVIPNGPPGARGQDTNDVIDIVGRRGVTGQRRAEQVPANTEAHGRAARNAIPTMTWEGDPSGAITWLSEAWHRYCGVSTTELTGTGWLATIHPDELAEEQAQWHEAMRSGEHYARRRRIRRASDNVWRWHLAHAEPVRGIDGEIARWVGSMTDVHDPPTGLEERVGDEAAAREASTESVTHAQQMQALGQIAGGVAHEFNNILQAIQGAAGLIEARPEDPASVQKFSHIIHKSSERAAVITTRLLSIVRRNGFRATRIKPATMLDGLCDFLTHTLGGRVTVKLDLQPGLNDLSADATELETVLINLATNARDAMPDGGIITLFAAAETIEAERLHPAQLKAGRYVRLSVSDSGIGMSPVTASRAAEPFFTTKPPGSGTGLGLSLAKGFAERSGGALAIESTFGRGTAVTLWLPVANGSGAADGRPAPRQASAAIKSGWRVLLVDDEAMVRETLGPGLTSAGFCVLVADSGLAALDLLEAGQPVDVLVSDLAMPGMDGVTLIRKAQACRRGLPAMILTGHTAWGEAITAESASDVVLSVLGKPITAAHLAERLESKLSAMSVIAEPHLDPCLSA